MAARKRKDRKRVKKTAGFKEQFKPIELTMKRYRYDSTALLEVLNTAQQTLGYLSEEILQYISAAMKVPYSRVYGVATFYHMFTFEPKGDHNCVVCTGTACHVKGADRIIEAVSKAHGISDGETTPDRKLSLSSARCVGSCGLAPVVVFDGVVMGKQTPDSVLNRITETLPSLETSPVVEGGRSDG